ncbi:MAG: LLM class F420-dependent oxidoreductase [Candidatus Binatia bacterium]|nr:MAG: LLM class F420-dependent oxidoreductase [Candidatus Binatia bacterium]
MKTAVSRREFLRLAGVAAAGTLLPWPRSALSATRRIRFGIQTPQQQVTYREILEVWKDADRLGYDTAFVFDHFIPIFSQDTGGPCFEGWTLLSALATETEKLHLGVLVTGNTYRYPPVLAKMAVTLDHISKGRLILGLGAGWFELEHEAYGIPFYTAGERAKRLVEAVELIKLLFTQKRSNYQGKYYRLQDAPFSPKSVQKPYPPILIGGMGPKVIQPLAAKHADIWHFFADGGPSEARAVNERFDALCRKVGRNPAEVERAIFLRSAKLEGESSAATVETVKAYVDAGVQHFIVSLRPPYNRDLVRRFAEEVVPSFRS